MTSSRAKARADRAVLTRTRRGEDMADEYCEACGGLVYPGVGCDACLAWSRLIGARVVDRDGRAYRVADLPDVNPPVARPEGA